MQPAYIYNLHNVGEFCAWLHSTTQVVSRLHATVLDKSYVVQIGLYK
jgi:hypothetical protein